MVATARSAAAVSLAAVHPYLIMNPKSGGGKVGKFGLEHQAEHLGAEVFLMEGPEPVNVAEVARQAAGPSRGHPAQAPAELGQAVAPRSPPQASAPPQ